MYNNCMQTLFLVLTSVLGAVFGSFLCCQVRRMKAINDGKRIQDKRSVCLKCGYRLKWYDNMPIVSWLMLGGKCRKCHEKIGVMEIIAEVAGMVGFLMIGIKYGGAINGEWYEWARLIIMLVFYAILLFLALFDGKYGEMPTVMLIVAIVVGGGIFALNVWKFDMDIVRGLIGVALLGGSYLMLYLLSHERLVGSGDWMLGTAIGLALSDWWLALFTIFLSNFLAGIVMVPVTMIKKKKNAKVYFGPWMVLGYMVVMMMSEVIFQLLR